VRSLPLDLNAVIAVLHSRQFDTVLGRIGFDEKRDVTSFDPWHWSVWQADGPETIPASMRVM
jgi:hypothetical protein